MVCCRGKSHYAWLRRHHVSTSASFHAKRVQTCSHICIVDLQDCYEQVLVRRNVDGPVTSLNTACSHELVTLCCARLPLSSELFQQFSSASGAKNIRHQEAASIASVMTHSHLPSMISCLADAQVGYSERMAVIGIEIVH